MVKKKEDEVTKTYFLVRNGKVDCEELNSKEWLSLLQDSLKSCKPLLRQMAENKKSANTIMAFLNKKLTGEGYHHSEVRIVGEDVLKTIPKVFLVNDYWLFIPIVTLEESEKKGQFFERCLFILADYPVFVIMETKYRKEPIDCGEENQKQDPPLINEKVVSVEFIADRDLFKLKDGEMKFESTILPYLADKKKQLGKKIIDSDLEPAIDILRDKKSEVKK